MPTIERRTADRTHAEPWPEAMREEFRKIEFLATVEVQEVDPDLWHDVVTAFGRSHHRFI